MNDIKPSAGAQINTLQNRLVMCQSDLAVLEEKRENTKREIDAIRNYLNGVSLGTQHANEQREVENKKLAEALKAQANEQPESPGLTD